MPIKTFPQIYLVPFCSSKLLHFFKFSCLKPSNKRTHIPLLLCIKPGIQERGTEYGECGELEECYIPGNVVKHSREYPQRFRGVSSNLSGNVGKCSGECCQTFRGMPSKIPGNVAKHSGEYLQTFRGMSPNIPGNVLKYSWECRQTLNTTCHLNNI